VRTLASKTISVTEEVYNLLKKMRLPGESFGDTIARLCRMKTVRSIKEWMEATPGWSDMTEEELAEFEKAVESVRSTLRVEGVDIE